MEVKRRLAIFLHYDRANVIQDYVVCYLSGLKQIAADIKFFSNSMPCEKELEKIQAYVSTVTLRENSGLDFGAWREAILNLGLNKIAEGYDELILANDSCYPTLSPFSVVFDNMSHSSCDMWGITENKAPTYRCGENFYNISPHIQSYFLVFRQSILRSVCFSRFWERMILSLPRDEIIVNYEVGLTKLLRENGFLCDVYCSDRQGDMEVLHALYGKERHDLALFYGLELVKRGSPLLKVKAIRLAIDCSHAQRLRDLKKTYGAENRLELLGMIDAHLSKNSLNYRLLKWPVFAKFCFALKRFLRAIHT